MFFQIFTFFWIVHNFMVFMSHIGFGIWERIRDVTGRKKLVPSRPVPSRPDVPKVVPLGRPESLINP